MSIDTNNRVRDYQSIIGGEAGKFFDVCRENSTTPASPQDCFVSDSTQDEWISLVSGAPEMPLPPPHKPT